MTDSIGGTQVPPSFFLIQSSDHQHNLFFLPKINQWSKLISCYTVASDSTGQDIRRNEKITFEKYCPMRQFLV
jgi:hypothetical protein